MRLASGAMERLVDVLVPAGLILLPALAIVVGGFVLGWLEQFEPAARSSAPNVRHVLAALPFAALSAAMVLAPVVVAVWAVIAEELAFAYLATSGFAVGAVALAALAAGREAAGKDARWARLPGVVLTSAVGFFVALTSFLGGALARSLGLDVGDGWRVAVPIAVAATVGGLAAAADRKRRAHSAGEGAPTPATRRQSE